MYVCAVAWPQAGASPGEAALTVIRTCQYAGRGSADKFQIVSIADERSAGDARGVTLDWPLLNKSHLPFQQQAASSRKAGRLSHPLVPLSPCSPSPFCLPSPPTTPNHTPLPAYLG